MKSTLKRTLAVMLVFMMVFSCFSGSFAYAAGTEGSGSTGTSKSDTSGTDTSGSDTSDSDTSDSDVSDSDVSGSDVSGSDVSASDVRKITSADIDSGNEKKDAVSCLGGSFKAVIKGENIFFKIALFQGNTRIGSIALIGSDSRAISSVTIPEGTYTLPANNTDQAVEYTFYYFAADTDNNDIVPAKGTKLAVVTVDKKTDMLEVKPEVINFTDKGGSVEVVLKYNCGVGMSLADSSWLTAAQVFGADNKPVTRDGGVVVKVTAAANTGLARENVLTFFTSNPAVKDYVPYKVEVKITQDGVKGVERLAGKDRIETAVAISKEGWEKAGTVIIASAEKYADALAGAPLSAAADAPILLTSNKNTGLEQSVLEEIKRLGATKVYILGGTSAVCPEIENSLVKAGCTVARLAGADRYETAVKIAAELTKLTGKKFTNLYFASGVNFPDALSISSVAAIEGNPILYMPAKGDVNSTTAKFITDGKYSSGVVLGGTSAISAEGLTSLTKLGLAVSRVSGDDRYETSAAINKKFDSLFTGKLIAVATGENFPDALAGGALCAKLKMPVVLVSEKSAASALEYIKGEAPEGLAVFGGPNAVSEAVAVKLAAGVKLPAVQNENK